MIDAKQLLDRFLGAQGGNRPPGAPAAPGAGFQLPGGLSDITRHVPGGAAGLAAGAGLLATMLGGKKLRKMTGGAIGYGGAAALGALAYRAWQNWQAQQGAQPASGTPQPASDRFLPSAAPAADGTPFELALVRTMVAAAKADGHVDAAEQRAIFEAVERAGLDAEAKAFVFDLLRRDIPFEEIAAGAATPEQAAELYLAARLAIDPDEASERAWLAALAHRLSLPDGLVAQIEAEAQRVG
ncbi:DUF533 domain-containing protein [Falsiroseomonas bella]|uniref:DUF533 domain-containing protein n=1 Tax=Falsiroseomonas bella TaxID=2184016 RepID=A0A317FGU5_9PROT|nr:tellurite resistance TerB family protein [Falsiroseomonas bella]PWS38290.1 DUF533 domain-containing protein [Falsiroseomonas bella]